MRKFDEATALYQQQMESLGIAYDHDLLYAVTKGLEPSIYLQNRCLQSFL